MTTIRASRPPALRARTRTAFSPPPQAPAAGSLRFLHEMFYYELLPSAVGLDEPAFAAVAPAIEATLLEVGCDYVEVDE